jgi:hypothetical protein
MDNLTPQECQMVEDLINVECFPNVSRDEHNLFVRVHGLTPFQYMCIWIVAFGTWEERQRKKGIK